MLFYAQFFFFILSHKCDLTKTVSLAHKTFCLSHAKHPNLENPTWWIYRLFDAIAIGGKKKKKKLVETWEIPTIESFWSWVVLTIPNFWRFSSYYHSSMMEIFPG